MTHHLVDFYKVQEGLGEGTKRSGGVGAKPQGMMGNVRVHGKGKGEGALGTVL